MIWT